jgi:hypothetical protein
MARKKTEVQQNGEPPPAAPVVLTLETQPADAAPTPAADAPPKPAEEPARGGEAKQKPVVSYSLQSDRTTRLEVSVWSNVYRNDKGEEWEQLACTFARSYKTDQGWQRGGAYRTHDLPVLLFLVQKAMTFAYDRRLTDSNSLPV